MGFNDLTPRPSSDQISARSFKNPAENAVLDPTGRPLRLPDCPGFQAFKLGYASIVSHCCSVKLCGSMAKHSSRATRMAYLSVRGLRFLPASHATWLKCGPIKVRRQVSSVFSSACETGCLVFLTVDRFAVEDCSRRGIHRMRTRQLTKNHWLYFQ